MGPTGASRTWGRGADLSRLLPPPPSCGGDRWAPVPGDQRYNHFLDGKTEAWRAFLFSGPLLAGGGERSWAAVGGWKRAGGAGETKQGWGPFISSNRCLPG